MLATSSAVNFAGAPLRALLYPSKRSLLFSLNYNFSHEPLVLREPSLGPCLGQKGGATGGGKSKIHPEDKINLHFPGDMHAITTATNLISALIDNHPIFESRII